jgi:hypothetical protein
MEKQHLFALLSFFAVIGWLEVLQINTGFAYACWILIGVTGLNLLYTFCKQDTENDGHY